MTAEPVSFAASTETLAHIAVQQKALARKNRTQRDIRFAVGCALGFVTVWALAHLLAEPQPRTPQLILFGSVAGGVLGWLMVSQLRQVLAACPVCAHSWEIKEGRTVPISERMETWDKCPGCGLLMADWALKRAAEGKPRL